MPENRLESGFSAVSAHKRTPLQSNSAAGFRAFYGCFSGMSLISSIDKYIEINSEKMICFKDTALKNDTITGEDFPIFKPGITNIICNGPVNQIEIIPRWCCL